MRANINIRHTIRVAIALGALLAAFVIPAQASAQENCANSHSDPTASQYCPQSEVLGASGGGGTTPEAVVVEEAPEAVEQESSSAGATLPFTGLDVGILLLAAVALGGSGLVLRRLSRHGVSKG